MISTPLLLAFGIMSLYALLALIGRWGMDNKERLERYLEEIER